MCQVVIGNPSSDAIDFTTAIAHCPPDFAPSSGGVICEDSVQSGDLFVEEVGGVAVATGWQGTCVDENGEKGEIGQAIAVCCPIQDDTGLIGVMCDPDLQTCYELIICENEIRGITCPLAQVIQIDAAFYGRERPNLCHPPVGQDGDCPDSLDNGVVLEYYQSQCNGQVSCEVSANSDDLPDPCSGVSKYALVSYSCINPQ